MRFAFIQKLCDQTVVKPRESKEHERSRKIDAILTGRYTAIPAFIGIMALVFFLTFNVIGAWLQGLLESGIDWLTGVVDSALTAWNINEVLHSLVIDGVFNGVGSVLSFVPIIVHPLLLPLPVGRQRLYGPGGLCHGQIAAENWSIRAEHCAHAYWLWLYCPWRHGQPHPSFRAGPEDDHPADALMSCSAKLPIYGFFTAVFFPGRGGLIMVGLYFLGILVGILMALLSKNTMFKGEAVPFVMELPNYRMPGAKNVAHLLWDKAKDFLQRAFTVIFLATIVVWFLQTFDFHLNVVADSQDSILATIAGLLTPIFAPLGFGDWRVSTALIAGFMAKESVVSTLSVLFHGTETLLMTLTPLAAASLLVFCLLYTPCVAAIASIKRELGGKWALGVVIGQCVIAWICALFVRVIGLSWG